MAGFFSSPAGVAVLASVVGYAAYKSGILSKLGIQPRKASGMEGKGKEWLDSLLKAAAAAQQATKDMMELFKNGDVGGYMEVLKGKLDDAEKDLHNLDAFGSDKMISGLEREVKITRKAEEEVIDEEEDVQKIEDEIRKKNAKKPPKDDSDEDE